MSSTAGPSGRRRRGAPAPTSVAGPGRGHERRPAAADLDELGQDRYGDLGGGLGPEVDPGRRPHREDAVRLDALVEEPGPDGRGPGRAGDQPDVGDVEPERRGDRLLVPDALAGDDDVRPDGRARQGGEVVADDDAEPRRQDGSASATGSIRVTSKPIPAPSSARAAAIGVVPATHRAGAGRCGST